MTDLVKRLREESDDWIDSGLLATGLLLKEAADMLEKQEKQLSRAKEVMEWYADFKIQHKWAGLVSPGTPFSKDASGLTDPVNPASEFLKEIEKEIKNKSIRPGDAGGKS